jgi:hypothetical protein
MATQEHTAKVIDFRTAARRIKRQRREAKRDAGLQLAFYLRRDMTRAKAHAAL